MDAGLFVKNSKRDKIMDEYTHPVGSCLPDNWCLNPACRDSYICDQLIDQLVRENPEILKRECGL